MESLRPGASSQGYTPMPLSTPSARPHGGTLLATTQHEQGETNRGGSHNRWMRNPLQARRAVCSSRACHTSYCAPRPADGPQRPSARWRCAWAVVPEGSPWLRSWDIFIIAVTFLTAFYEPFVVALLRDDPPWVVVVDACLDLAFVADMSLQFFRAYQLPVDGQAGRELWERNPCNIARRYCSFPMSYSGEGGWFWIDLLAVLPGMLSWGAFHLGSLGSRLGGMLVLLRMLRLCRITKLFRSSGIVRRLHLRLGFRFYKLELVKFVAITSLTVHWLACVWVAAEGRLLRGKMSFTTGDESWFSSLVTSTGFCHEDAMEDIFCGYVSSVWWAGMTLTTVGYGNVLPQNLFEYVVCIMSMLILSFTWAFIIANIVTVLMEIDPQEARFKRMADDLQGMMSSLGLPASLQQKLRSHMKHSREVLQQVQQGEILEAYISEGLQREVAKHSSVSRMFVESVYWAKDLQSDALFDLVRALVPYTFGPGEVVTLPQTLLMIRHGIAMHMGTLLSRGCVCGESDVFLETQALLSKFLPRTLSHVDLVALHKEDLVTVCTIFPQADRRIRRAQIRTAVWRAFVAEAERRRSRQSRRRSGVLSVSVSAITSFVSPGESRLEVGCMPTAGRTRESKELVSLMHALMQKHNAVEERVLGKEAER